ncbi:photosystem II protein PsbQ [Pleurocapsa sp. FMAR1]|uniref:photosystem II protein PsbQ n=1 Tax=Pleurocapsa sp. FMAR1 TaxID=3040204 RepID=UPI0029C75FF4|nr:photosystem II protein PsbQ [Pleurocapsa sp. FMAR1]
MKIFRPILSLILVLVTTLLVSCGGSNVSAPPTYTPEKLQKIETYRIPLDIARQRISELGESISNENWSNAKSFLHGPLGSIRRDLTYLSKALLPDEQEPALEQAKDIFRHLENIDAAVSENNYSVATDQYKKVVSDLDTYASLIPQTEKPAKQAQKVTNKVEKSVNQAQKATTKAAEKSVNQAERAKSQAEDVFEGVKAEVNETIKEITPNFGEDT